MRARGGRKRNESGQAIRFCRLHRPSAGLQTNVIFNISGRAHGQLISLDIHRRTPQQWRRSAYIKPAARSFPTPTKHAPTTVQRSHSSMTEAHLLTLHSGPASLPRRPERSVCLTTVFEYIVTHDTYDRQAGNVANRAFSLSTSS